MSYAFIIKARLDNTRITHKKDKSFITKVIAQCCLKAKISKNLYFAVT